MSSEARLTRIIKAEDVEVGSSIIVPAPASILAGYSAEETVMVPAAFLPRVKAIAEVSPDEERLKALHGYEGILESIIGETVVDAEWRTVRQPRGILRLLDNSWRWLNNKLRSGSITRIFYVRI